jgi:hypothetical protein
MRAVSMLLAGMCAAMIAGCSGPADPPVVTTEPPSSTSPVPSTKRGLAPTVTRTLDLTAHLANPCDLLGKPDFDTLGFAGRFVVIPPGTAEKGRTCEVGGGSNGGFLHLTLRADASPLQEAYADDSGKFEYFRAIDLAGIPAAAQALSVRHPGECAVLAGTGQAQGLRLYHEPSSRDGGTAGICDRLSKVAESVLKKLGA